MEYNTPPQQNALQASPAAAPSVNPLSMLSQPGGGALAAVTSNEKVVETLASIFIAKNFPRDLAAVTANMTAATSRVSLAQKAVYTYPRGGASVEGPSVHLADALLGAWGNAESGWQEISRHKDPKKGCMVSECVAYAFDKETNLKYAISFSVPHWRDTRGGGYELTDERDIYELCANMAARRRRAAILRVLPAWLVEEALENCNETLRRADGNKPLPDLIRRMEAKFAGLGVTRAQLEAKLGHNLEATTRNELVTLGKHYNALEGGHARVSELFDAEPKAAPMTAATPAPAPVKRKVAPAPVNDAPDSYPEEEAELANGPAEVEPADIFEGDNLPGLEPDDDAKAEAALEALKAKLATTKRRTADVLIWARKRGVKAPELGARRHELAKFAFWLTSQTELYNELCSEFGFDK